MKKLLLGVLAALLLVSAPASAATRDFEVQWTHDCLTTMGDTLDVDSNGTCELLGGWRVYTEAGELVADVPEDGSRVYSYRFNAPWGTQCFYMTAWMPDPLNPGAELESVPSNIGACLDVVPGNPNAPAAAP